MADHDDPKRPDRGDDDNNPNDPFEQLFRSMGFGNLGGDSGQQPDLNQLMQQVQNMLQQFGMGGAMGSQGVGFRQPTSPDQARWEQIRDLARRAVAAQGADPTPDQRQITALRDAVRLADMWLDEVTHFGATGGPVEVWSRAEWVENSMPTWRRAIDPVSESLAEAMANTVGNEGSDQESPFGGFEALLKPWLKQSGAHIFGLQAGQALGLLAASVMSGTEAGLPLDGKTKATIALIPTNIAAFSEGLGQSSDDINLYLALRESARQRLFNGVPWLGPQLLALVEQYAAGITIDLSGIEDAMGELDPTNLNPESLQEMAQNLQGSLFEPKQTPEQKETLARLETLLALVEGWVDEVVAQATARWMPNAVSLAETFRRRHATNGPIEATFKALVGLELRPRRMRDAANLWALLRTNRSADGRDAVWNHPDLLPTAADLDDPLGFVEGDRRDDEPDSADLPSDTVDDMDAELERLLTTAEQEREQELLNEDDQPEEGPDTGGPETGGDKQ